MSFTARLYFSGLGLALFHTSQTKSRQITDRVELHTLRTPKHHDQHPEPHDQHPEPHDPHSEPHDQHSEPHDQHSEHHDQHVPRLSFELRDLAEPVGMPIRNIRPTPDATMMMDFLVEGQKLELIASGENEDFNVVWADDSIATEPGKDAPEDAIDWLPSTEHILPGGAFVRPDEDPDREIYSTSMILPPGKIYSRRILYAQYPGDQDGQFVPRRALWKLPQEPLPRVMTDQLVWTRSGLDALSIEVQDDFGDPQILKFDAGMRHLDQDDPVIELAFTNFPELGLTGRFGFPTHFKMYRQMLGARGAAFGPLDFTIALHDQVLPVTGQGSCPPARGTISGGS